MFPSSAEKYQHMLKSKPYRADEARPMKHGRCNNCPKSWRVTNRLFCEDNISRNQKRKGLNSRKDKKIKETITHYGYYTGILSSDYRYSRSNPSKDRLSSSWYWSFRSIYNYEISGNPRYKKETINSLCMESYNNYYNDYDTHSARKKLLLNLTRGMLCYYWNDLYYVCGIIEFDNKLNITLLSDWPSKGKYQRHKISVTVRNRYYVDSKCDEKIFVYGLDILPYYPLNWNIYLHRRRAVIIDETNTMYLNINLPKLILYPSIWAEQVAEYNRFWKDINEKKLFESMRFYFKNYNYVLSRFCKDTFDLNYKGKFVKLPNIWVEMDTKCIKLDGDNKYGIDLKFSNNYSCCIIYNFLSQEWKIPNPQNCPNWLTYPCIEPVKLDKPMTIELTCYTNPEIFQQPDYDRIRISDVGNFDNSNNGNRIEQLFYQFDDNVQKGLIKKVPKLGYYYFEELENVFDLLICGYISRFFKVRNCAFFNVNDINNIIHRYYGKCYHCYVTQFCFVDKIGFGENEWTHKFKEYNKNNTQKQKEKEKEKEKQDLNFEITKQVRCGVEWIGTSDDMYNFSKNMTLRLGIKIDIEYEFGDKSGNCRCTRKMEYMDSFMDIVCINDNEANTKKYQVETKNNKCSDSKNDTRPNKLRLCLLNNDLIEMKTYLDEKSNHLSIEYFKNGLLLERGDMKMNCKCYDNSLWRSNKTQHKLKHNDTRLRIDLNNLLQQENHSLSIIQSFNTSDETTITCHFLPYVKYLPMDTDHTSQVNFCNEFMLYYSFL